MQTSVTSPSRHSLHFRVTCLANECFVTSPSSLSGVCSVTLHRSFLVSLFPLPCDFCTLLENPNVTLTSSRDWQTLCPAWQPKNTFDLFTLLYFGRPAAIALPDDIHNLARTLDISIALTESTAGHQTACLTCATTVASSTFLTAAGKTCANARFASRTDTCSTSARAASTIRSRTMPSSCSATTVRPGTFRFPASSNSMSALNAGRVATRRCSVRQTHSKTSTKLSIKKREQGPFSVMPC